MNRCLPPDSQMLLGNFPPIPSSFPRFICWAWFHMYGISFWLGQSAQNQVPSSMMAWFSSLPSQITITELTALPTGFLHISTTTFSLKWVYFTIWSIMTMEASSKNIPPADLYWYISTYYFIPLTLVPRSFKHLFQSTPAAMLGDPHIYLQ